MRFNTALKFEVVNDIVVVPGTTPTSSAITDTTVQPVLSTASSTMAGTPGSTTSGVVTAQATSTSQPRGSPSPGDSTDGGSGDSGTPIWVVVVVVLVGLGMFCAVAVLCLRHRRRSPAPDKAIDDKSGAPGPSHANPAYHGAANTYETSTYLSVP